MLARVWPRMYAAAILALKTPEERTRYLQDVVPEEFRDWVKFLVEDHYAKRKAQRQHESKKQQSGRDHRRR